MSPGGTPESVLCLDWAEGVSGESGHRTEAQVQSITQARRLHPPPPNKTMRPPPAQKLKHLLHGDGVEEPGVEALGGKGEKV